MYLGGDPEKGETYGYVSWVDGRAVLTVRNPDRGDREILVPFDRSVYFRGEYGKPYRVRAIYPYVEEMPWIVVSGRSFPIPVPGDSTVVYELEPGAPTVAERLRPGKLPAFRTRPGEAFVELAPPEVARQVAEVQLKLLTW